VAHVGREEETRRLVQPVEDVIEEIHFPGGGKDVDGVESQTEKIKIEVGHRKRFPGVKKNNDADDQSGQSDQRQIKIQKAGSPLSQEERREEQLSPTADLILDFLARRPGCPMTLDDIDFAGDRQVVDGIQDISLFDSVQVGRSLGLDDRGDVPAVLLLPEHSVGWLLPDRFFIDVDPPQDEQDGDEEEGDRETPDHRFRIQQYESNREI
jgi:hypothetical protein